MDEFLKNIVKSPKLNFYKKAINDHLAIESKKRKEYYNSLNDDKTEFIYGDVITHGPNTLRISQCTLNLMVLISSFVQVNDLGFVGYEKCMISLSRNDYEPDVCFFKKSKSEKFHLHQLHYPAPDFIAEVLSPSTEYNDRVIKFEDYAAHGIEEYWIIDPEKQSVEQYKLSDSQYILIQKSNNGIIKSFAVKDFTIPIESIFDDKLNLQVLKNILNN